MNRFVLSAACVLLGFVSAAAEDLALSTVEKAAPDAVAEEIRAVLDAKALVLSDGAQPVWEFWFRTAVPLASAPAAGKPGFDAIKKTTLLGVLQLHREQRDFKDNVIEKGVYTMRYATQPEDGNHMGTATSPHFVILLPVSFDTTLETTMDNEKMADESSASSVAEHPMNLNLQPLGAEGSVPAIGEGTEDSKVLNVELNAEAAGATVPLRFGLVFEGKGHIQ